MEIIGEANEWKTNYPAPYPARVVTRASVPTEGLVRGTLGRASAAITAYVIVPISVAFLGIGLLFSGSVASWIILAAGLGVSLVVASMAVLLVFLIAKYGIVTGPVGIDVFGYTLSRRLLSCRTIKWSEVRRVETLGLFSETVWLGHSNLAVMVTPELARVILSDKRCPLQGRVPLRIAKRIGLSAPLR